MKFIIYNSDTSAIWGNFKGLMYPFLNCSLMNSYISSLSFLDNRYTFLFLDTNLFFVSIALLHIFFINILSLAFFPKIWFICEIFEKLIS